MMRVDGGALSLDSLHSYSTHPAYSGDDLPSNSPHHPLCPDGSGGVEADAVADADASVSSVAVRVRALARAQASGVAPSWTGNWYCPSYQR